MQAELLTTVVAGGFAIGGIIVGAGLTYLASLFEHRRRKNEDLERGENRERAILHGAFALSNFISSRLNDWEKTHNVIGLERLAVAQPYVTKLIESAPSDSDRLMVSLVDLGLRLESLVFVCRLISQEQGDELLVGSGEVDRCVAELSASVDLIDIIVTGELPFMTEEELVQFSGLEQSEAPP